MRKVSLFYVIISTLLSMITGCGDDMVLESRSKSKQNWRQKDIIAIVRSTDSKFYGPALPLPPTLLPGGTPDWLRVTTASGFFLDTHGSLSVAETDSFTFKAPRARWYRIGLTVTLQSTLGIGVSGPQYCAFYLYKNGTLVSTLGAGDNVTFPMYMASTSTATAATITSDNYFFLSAGDVVGIKWAIDSAETVYMKNFQVTFQTVSEEYL